MQKNDETWENIVACEKEDIKQLNVSEARNTMLQMIWRTGEQRKTLSAYIRHGTS